MSHLPNFVTNHDDHQTIMKIVKRAQARAVTDDVRYDWGTIVMDLKACHCNGRPLDLERLLHADEETFVHDIYGIRKHLDRETGKLNGFLPKCSR